MINIVSLSDTNDPNSNLSLQVLSSVADANAATDPAGLNTTFLNTGGQSEVNKLIESNYKRLSTPLSLKQPTGQIQSQNLL